MPGFRMPSPLVTALFATGLLVPTLTQPIAAGDQKQGSEQEQAERAERARQLAALKKKMKTRYAALKAMLDAGKIGETHAGMVALVKAAYGKARVDPKKKDSPTLAALVTAENADRTALYRLLAAQLGTKPATIAKQNAARHFKKAEARHYLQLRSGKWATKKQVDDAIEARKKEEADRKKNAR